MTPFVDATSPSSAYFRSLCTDELQASYTSDDRRRCRGAFST